MTILSQIITTTNFLENFDFEFNSYYYYYDDYHKYFETFRGFKDLYPFIFVAFLLFVIIIFIRSILLFINKFITSIQYVLNVIQHTIVIIFCLLASIVLMDIIVVTLGFDTYTLQNTLFIFFRNGGFNVDVDDDNSMEPELIPASYNNIADSLLSFFKKKIYI